MKKVSFILSIFLFLGCSSKKEHNSNFSMDQIEQLQLSNVKPINILDKDKLLLDFNVFLTEKEISINELVDNVKLIPLQTTEESLIVYSGETEPLFWIKQNH